MTRLAVRLALGVVLVVLAAGAADSCVDFSGAPSSRWKTTTEDGVAWLVTPCGDRFFSLGVNLVDGGARARDGAGGYHWSAFRSSLSAWARMTREVLAGWGFNTAGAWSLPPRTLEMPSTIELSLGRRESFVWDDPFHPALPARVQALARRLTTPYRGDPRRIGYFSDNEIGWWNGPLFVAYTKYPSSNHTKQRLVRMLRERYADNWSSFERDFVPPPTVRSFESLLRETRTPTRLRPGGDGFAAVRAWTAIVADHYYRMMREAILAADPEALYLGDRLPIYYDVDAVRAMAPHVDVISTNYNADGPDGWIARYYFAALRQLASRPVLVTEWFFAAHENRSGNLNRTGPPKSSRIATDQSNNVNRTGHLMTVATQADRALGAAAAAEAMAREPSVVGLHWFQYYDHPRGGRVDGEDYNFGLVDVRDQPYEALVGALRRVNMNARRLHAEGLEPAPAGPLAIPFAPVDARDGVLTEWPKEPALLPLRGVDNEALFGDVYLAWDEEGLSMAVIAMDYYDADLMAAKDGLPRSETFRVDLGLRVGDRARRVQLAVIPEPLAAGSRKPEFRVEGCTVEAVVCAPVAIAARFFGVAMDQPRVIFEAKLPWAVIGVRAAARTEVGLAVDVTSFYRGRSMTLTGGSSDPATWRPARLAPR